MCEGYKLVAGSLDEPEIILLGEIHGSEFDFNSLSIKCVNTLINALPIDEPHLVLLEGVEQKEEVPCETKKYPKFQVAVA